MSTSQKLRQSEQGNQRYPDRCGQSAPSVSGKVLDFIGGAERDRAADVLNAICTAVYYLCISGPPNAKSTKTRKQAATLSPAGKAAASPLSGRADVASDGHAFRFVGKLGIGRGLQFSALPPIRQSLHDDEKPALTAVIRFVRRLAKNWPHGHHVPDRCGDRRRGGPSREDLDVRP